MMSWTYTLQLIKLSVKYVQVIGHLSTLADFKHVNLKSNRVRHVSTTFTTIHYYRRLLLSYCL